MAQIEITSEEESPGGWSFAAQVVDRDGQLHRFTLHLSWADYNLWSPNGADSPAQVAEAALGYFLSKRPIAELKSSLDASLLRRIDPDTDEKLPDWIGR